jgi:hypothetical protein
LYFNTGGDFPGSEIGVPPGPGTPPGVGDFWALNPLDGGGPMSAGAGPQAEDPVQAWACFDPVTGNWTDDMSNVLISPVMDITGFTNPQLTYDAVIDLPPENTDKVALYVSADNGTNYTWLTDIGGPAGIPTPSFNVSAFSSSEFRAMFWATSGSGDHTEGMYIKNISVVESVPPQPPVPSFTYSPSKPLVSANVTFNGTASMDYDGTIVSYLWSFGDGTTATGATVSHKYETPWMYPVTLLVTDSGNMTGKITKNVLVPLLDPALPAVSTSSPQSTTYNSATVRGNLLNIGDYGSADVSFEWGTTSGSLTNETTPQTMTSTGEFSAGIAGLTPETPYYYRAKAVAGAVTTYGDELNFTTPVEPFTVTTSAAANLTMTSAVLNGSLPSLGTYGTANVSFMWGTTSGALGNETAPQPMDTTGSFFDSISGLTPDTPYYFRAKAVSDSETVFGDELSFTTLAPLAFVSMTPSPNSPGAAASSDIELEFSSAVNGTTVNANTLTVHGSFSGTVSGVYSVTGANVTFSPAVDLEVGETVSVMLTSAIQGYGAGNLTNPTVTQFVVRVPSGYARLVDTGQTLGSTYSQGVELGDLDGDGDLDALIANIAGQANRVWLNNGSANFTDSGQNLASGSYSYDIALGDLDNDGDLDAFMINYSGSGGAPNTVWLNDGNGSFSSNGQSLGLSDSHGVALGDLDGDGDLDAFVANFNSQGNTVWYNDGAGNFTDSGQSLGTATSNDVALGDLDNDGDLDAYIVNSGANKVWFNDGSGNFTDSLQSLGNSTSTDVALGDLDDDGDLDAFVTNSVSASDKVWLNDGSGTFTTNGQSLGSTYSQGTRLGDLDGDGDLDAFVTVSSASAQPNLVWLNDGSGNFTDSGLSLGNSMSYCVALGDLDGDDDLDAFVANTLNSADTVWLNEPEGATVEISVTLMGNRTVESQCIIPVTIKFFTPGADVISDIPLYSIDTTTVMTGTSAANATVIGIAPGTYDITIVSEHTLTNVKKNVVISSPYTPVNLGTLLEGDANSSGKVDILDVSTLIPAYGKSSGDPGYNPMADFDRNGKVDILDVSTLIPAYGKQSPILVP